MGLGRSGYTWLMVMLMNMHRLAWIMGTVTTSAHVSKCRISDLIPIRPLCLTEILILSLVAQQYPSRGKGNGQRGLSRGWEMGENVRTHSLLCRSPPTRGSIDGCIAYFGTLQTKRV